MARRTDIQEVLAYQVNPDWAACACTIVRKFGVKGAASLLKAIKDMITALEGAQSQINRMLDMANQIGGIFTRMQPSTLVQNEMYKQLAKVQVCPEITSLLSSIGGGAIEMLRNVEMQAFYDNKHQMLQQVQEAKKASFDGYLEQLQRLENFVSLMEGCASTDAISSGRSYESDVLAQDVKGKPQFEQYYEWLPLAVSANITEVGSELWAVYENPGTVRVRRRVAGVWQAAVYIIDGKYPTIFYDGTYVYVYFTLNNKVQELKFLVSELGTMATPLQLWDCVGFYSGNANAIVPDMHRSCSDKYTEAVLDSFPEGGSGVWPKLSLAVDGGWLTLSWNAVSVAGYTTRYRVYKNGVQIYETSGTNYIAFLDMYANYWVVPIFKSNYFNDDWSGCISNIMIVPWLARANEELYLRQYGSEGFVTQIDDYDVIIENTPQDNLPNYYGSNITEHIFDSYDVIIENTPQDNLPNYYGSNITEQGVENYFYGSAE